MARNVIFNEGEQLAVAVTDPASPKSGDPVRWGELTGVALTDENTAGRTTVRFTNAVVEIPVKGVNGGGNSAVADGDELFYVDADTPKVSKKVTGRLFGQAMGAVAAGATTTIRVRLAESKA